MFRGKQILLRRREGQPTLVGVPLRLQLGPSSRFLLQRDLRPSWRRWRWRRRLLLMHLWRWHHSRRGRRHHSRRRSHHSWRRHGRHRHARGRGNDARRRHRGIARRRVSLRSAHPQPSTWTGSSRIVILLLLLLLFSVLTIVRHDIARRRRRHLAVRRWGWSAPVHSNYFV